MTEEPESKTSNLVPEMAMTDVLADEYDHVPVADVVATVGDTMVMSASLYVALTSVHVNVGVALSTVRVAVVEAVVKLVASDGVNVAVMTDDPPPAMEAVDPFTVATEVLAEEYAHDPDTDVLLYVADGEASENGASPNVLDVRAKAPSVGVAR